MKWGTSESSRPKVAAVAKARTSATQEVFVSFDGQHSKAMASAAIALANQISQVTCSVDKPWTNKNKATKIGLEPLIGVIRLASPFLRPKKQKNWPAKNRKPRQAPTMRSFGRKG